MKWCTKPHANDTQITIPACLLHILYAGALYVSVSHLNTATKASVHLAESAVINHKTMCTKKDAGVIYLAVLGQDAPGNKIRCKSGL